MSPDLGLLFAPQVRRVVSKAKRKIILNEGKASMPDAPEGTRVDVIGPILDGDMDRVLQASY